METKGVNTVKEGNTIRFLIVEAMNHAFDVMKKQVPVKKSVTQSISIMDVKPTELIQFMKDNNVPDTASFDGRDNGYDGWDDILLSWQVEVDTTDGDKLAFKKKRFTDISWKYVYEALTNDGYVRQGVCSSLLKQFDNTTLYDMYMNGEWDRIETYYALRFVKSKN